MSDFVTALAFACLFFAAEPPPPDVHLTPSEVALHGAHVVPLVDGDLPDDRHVGQLVPDLYDPLLDLPPDEVVRVVVEPGVDIDTTLAVAFTVRQAGAREVRLAFVPDVP